MMGYLARCPVCKSAPQRINVNISAIEKSDVIFCPNGCKPHWNHVVIHIRSVDCPEWDDVGDAWNTIRINTDENGNQRVSFDRYPPHKIPIVADGPYNKWPRHVT